MVKIIEAVYENGVLKPVDASGLTEQRRYRLTLEELPAPESSPAPEVAAELARRTTLLPDGRRVFHLLGLFDRGDPGPDYDDIEAALDAARQATRSP
jgi:predicted DNA-binding antitoxin AbrB/MazE fold protein